VVAVDLEAHSTGVDSRPGYGLDPVELARRVGKPPVRITAGQLTHWLVCRRLAVLDDEGRLVATRLGLEIASALEDVGLG
jgi:hypothetical protein